MEQLQKLTQLSGLASDWNDHRAFLVLHCYKETPGVFSTEEIIEIKNWYVRNQEQINTIALTHIRAQWGASARSMAVPAFKRDQEVNNRPPAYDIGPGVPSWNEGNVGKGVVHLPYFCTDSLAINYPQKKANCNPEFKEYDEWPKAMARFLRRSYDMELDVVGGPMYRHMVPLVYEAKQRKGSSGKKGSVPENEGRREHITFQEAIADWVHANHALRRSEDDGEYICPVPYLIAIKGEQALIDMPTRTKMHDAELLWYTDTHTHTHTQQQAATNNNKIGRTTYVDFW